MTMPKQLMEVRDKLVNAQDGDSPRQFGIEEGFNATIETLSLEVEFDEQEARQNFYRYMNCCPQDDAHSFEQGAKWMFEQMKARVGLAVYKQEQFDIAVNNATTELRDKIKALEGELEHYRGVLNRINRINDHACRELISVAINPADSEIARDFDKD